MPHLSNNSDNNHNYRRHRTGQSGPTQARQPTTQRSGLAQDHRRIRARSRSTSSLERPRRCTRRHLGDNKDANRDSASRAHRRHARYSDELSNEDMASKTEIKELLNTKSGLVPRIDPPLKGPKHWPSWSSRLKWYFKSQEVEGYINGMLKRPDSTLDPENAKNWEKNNAHACVIIVSNLGEGQLMHTNPCNTSHKMWEALHSVHEQCGHQTAMNYIRTLFKALASNNQEIPCHLSMIKDTWEKVNVLSGEHFSFLDQFFKLVIASSLPPTWDPFTDLYMGSETGIYNNDLRHTMSSQEFLGVIISECKCYQVHTEIYYSGDTPYQNPRGRQPSRGGYGRGQTPLTYRTSDNPSTTRPSSSASTSSCKLCKKTGHSTDNCSRWGQNLCTFCHKLGHAEEECWTKDKDKRPARPPKNKQQPCDHQGSQYCQV
jgi:gag-polypeptide of LTR copia-type